MVSAECVWQEKNCTSKVKYRIGICYSTGCHRGIPETVQEAKLVKYGNKYDDENGLTQIVKDVYDTDTF